MLRTGYQNYYDQKIEHEAFIKKIGSLNLDDIKQNQDKYTHDLLVYIFDWLINHILYKDKLIKAV